jgi:hypothetical protein
MLRLKIIAVVSFSFLLFSPGLLHSQTKPFVLFDVLPAADHTVLIKWGITAEMDTLSFEVERSRDKKNWERIETVNPGILLHSYSITDREPGEGLIYYRIKQAGGKNLSVYTGIKWVQISKTGKLYIWPNPANNILHVKTPFVKGSMDIVDSGGKHIVKIIITDFITDIPAIHLSMGIYFLHVKHGNETLVEKFVKE